MQERRREFTLSGQLSAMLPLVAAWLLAGLVIAVAGLQDSVPIEHLFMDPASLTGEPWYTGLISNLGILGWTIAAVTAVSGAWVASQTGRPSAARFLAAGAVATTTLLADDLLQLHATLGPEVLGLSKTVSIAVVCSPAVVWAVTMVGEIVRTRWLVLVAATSGLAGSVVADRLLEPSTGSLFVEDGCKFFGIVAWAVYFTTTTVDISRSTIRAATAAPPGGSPDDLSLAGGRSPRSWPGSERRRA